MAIVRRQQPEAERGLARGRGWDPFELMQDLMRWDPFREISRAALAGGEAAAYVPSFEVKETKDAYLFRADLPGVKEDDLDISLTGNRLTISGQRKEEKRDESDTYFCFERNYGSFSRTFTLPDGADAEHLQGELRDGVLSVVLPKKPEVQPKHILLKGASKGEKEKAKA